MKKNIINALALFSTVAIMAFGCGGGSDPGTDACPAGQIKSVATGAANTNGPYCTMPTTTATDIQTNTATTSSVVTNTVTGTGTNTTSSTDTATTTATSTWTPTAACDYASDRTITGGAATKQSGLWVVTGAGTDWNLCITQVDSVYPTEVVGYAFKTNELGQAIPPSLVAYTGVMANKCVMLYPNTVSKDGPLVQGNSVIGNNEIGFTITDGVTTAKWVAQGTAIPGCPYKVPGT